MAMKDSGIAWIGEVPENWSIKSLKFLFDMYAGGDVDEYNTSDEQTVNYNYPIYSNSLENNGLFGYTNKYRFEGKTFTVTGRGAVGNAIARFDKYYPIVRLLVCVPKNNDDNRYYTYCVNSADLLGEQTAMAQLTTLKLGMTKHPVPPIMEQQLIADFLDDKVSKIDNILTDLNKQVEMLNAYKKSLITETVTKGLNPNVPTKDSDIDWIGKIPEHWTTMRVKNLALSNNSLFMDGDWIESDVIVESGIRYLTTGNVGNGFYKEQGSGYITEETFKKLNCLKVYPGDLMISRLNEPIGRACIVPNDEDYYVVAVDNVILRPDKKHNKKYLMYCMNTPGYAEAGKEAARGSTMQRVSRTILGTFFVPVAPLQEQELIADFLDKKCAEIDDLIADKTAQIEKMEKYKKSLIFEYVTGKKRVKEVV